MTTYDGLALAFVLVCLLLRAIFAATDKALKRSQRHRIHRPAEPGHGRAELGNRLPHEGSVEKRDRDMFGGLLDLRDLLVSDVMIHRTEMITVCADDSAEEIINEVLQSPVTRVPLWSGKPENIIGILHAKDLLRAIKGANDDLSNLDVQAIA